MTKTETNLKSSLEKDPPSPEERASPEELGIPSLRILDFIEHLETKKLCMHGLMLFRHGKLAFEAHYPPFNRNSLHRMYSATKTFVSMAIGLMIDEGKISLESRLIDFFPEYSANSIPSLVAGIKVRDLLLMATPYDRTTYTVKDPNWIKTFFTAPPTHKSGTVFNYDTSGTVALNALVEKISGQNLIDYLRPRLLDPLGFSAATWCVERPEGGAWGGSGLLACIGDLARFGLFLLNKGSWRGKQLLSASYLEEACSPLIDNRITVGHPEMQFGYGYQIWQTRNGGFAAWGMGSQLCLCLPEKDLVLVTTGDTQSTPSGHDIILDAFWRDLYPYIEDNALGENREGAAKLGEKISALEFPAVDGKAASPRQQELSGRSFRFYENPMKLSRVSFVFKDGEGAMQYTNASGNHEIQFGLGVYREGVFPELAYFGKRIGKPIGRGYRYKASGAWFNPQSLTIYLYVTDDYLGTLKINCFFDNDSLSLSMSKAAEWFLDEYAGMATGKLESV